MVPGIFKEIAATSWPTFPLRTINPVRDPTSLETDEPILYVWPPFKTKKCMSFDIDCLTFQTWLQFVGFQCKISVVRDFGKSSPVNLPILQTTDGRILNKDEIVEHVLSSSSNVSLHPSSSEQSSLGIALLALVEKTIGRAVSRGFASSREINKYYADNYVFPLSRLIPWLISSNLNKQVTQDPDWNEKQVFVEAENALKTLSTLLADKEFLFGDEPFFIDAVLFAHCHVVLSTAAGDQKLREYVLKFPNLLEYCTKIWRSLK